MNTVLEAAEHGQNIVRSLDDFETLNRFAIALADVASAENAGLIAASGPAERLVGAAILISGGAALGWATSRSETALVCDVVLASGSSCTDAAAKAKRLGAARVVVVVIENLFDASSIGLANVDEVLVLGESSYRSRGVGNVEATGLSIGLQQPLAS